MPCFIMHRSSGWTRPAPRASVYSQGMSRPVAKETVRPASTGGGCPQMTRAPKHFGGLTRAAIRRQIPNHTGHAVFDAAAMQIEIEIGARQDRMREMPGQPLGRRSVFFTWKHARKVGPVCRTGSGTLPKGRRVEHRDSQEHAAHLLRADLFEGLKNRANTFVLVAVHAGGDHQRLSRTAAS